jgi:hypothetical protein
MKHIRESERGSVIWILMIAVVLFAALSATVANMMRGGGDINREMGNINATQVLQFTDAMRKSLQVMSIDGVGISKISFDTPGLTGYANTNCTASSCEVFHVNGGGISYDPPDEKWLSTAFETDPDYRQWVFPSDTCVQDYPGKDAANCSGDSIDNEDLVVMLPYVRKELCLKLNEQAGIENPGGDAPIAGSCHTAGGKFKGVFSESSVIDATELVGQPSGCFKQTQTCGAAHANYYVYYRVLLGR